MRRYSGVLTTLIAFAVVGIALALSGSSVGADRSSSQVGSGGYVYPLKVSESGRYLVDQRNVPFLMVGDSPQSMIGNISVSDAEKFIASRKAAGINTLWINLLCVQYTACRADGTTFDGIAPFTTPQDLSTPNEAYFARADAMISLAEKYGILVFLDPIETGGWLEVIRDNGVSKDYAYGRYVGERYRKFPNVIWFNGNDFQDWQDPALDAGVLAVARGIRSTQPNRLQTVAAQLRRRAALSTIADGATSSTSTRPTRTFQRTSRFSRITTDRTYPSSWSRPSTNSKTSVLTNPAHHSPCVDRRTGLFSAAPQGSSMATFTRGGSRAGGSLISTPPARCNSVTRLDSSPNAPGTGLFPIRNTHVVTSGHGAFGTFDYVTAAATPSGTLAIAYMPTARTISVDMGKLAGAARAQWFDPTNGKYSDVSGSPFTNSGTQSFTPPAKNSGGDSDWVLVLSASKIEPERRATLRLQEHPSRRPGSLQHGFFACLGVGSARPPDRWSCGHVEDHAESTRSGHAVPGR